MMADEHESQPIYVIEQVVAKPNPDEPRRPFLRFATHARRISPIFQATLSQRIPAMWGVINSDHFFRDVPEEESQGREAMLKLRHSTPDSPLQTVIHDSFENAFA
jgi:hypothetical protein